MYIYIYIININHITGKVYKFICITNISHIDKDKVFDKTKAIRPKTLVNCSHKKVTYDLQKTSLTNSLSQFSTHVLLS